MDAKPFVEHVLDDEGLSDGLADDEAKVLIDWLTAEIERQIPRQPSTEAAWAVTRALAARARRIARVTERLYYQSDAAEAARLWSAGGSTHSLTELSNKDPVKSIAQLIQWEQQTHA